MGHCMEGVLVIVTKYLTGSSLREKDLTLALLRAEDVWWEWEAVNSAPASTSLGLGTR